MLSQSEHLLFGFSFCICDEPVISRVHGTRIHEILPNQNAVGIAPRIHSVAFVHAAAPNAQHVHVHGLGIAQVLNYAFIAYCSFKYPCGDEVCSTHEVGFAVDNEPKVRALFINRGVEFDGANAGFEVL